MQHKIDPKTSASIFVFLLAFELHDPAIAVCTKTKSVAQSLDVIGLVVDDSLAEEVVEDAVDYWRRCANYGKGFPSFFIAAEAETSLARNLRIKMVTASGNQKCGLLRGDEIILYKYASLGHRRVTRCGDLAQNLAHELGHALGLNHSPKRSQCELEIMSKINPHNASRRAVSREECQAVGQMWWTSWELAGLTTGPRGDQTELDSTLGDSTLGDLPCQKEF